MQSAIKRYGQVEQVKLASGQTTTGNIPAGQWAWGSLDIPVASGFDPATVTFLVSNGEAGDFAECIDKNGDAIGAISITNKKALLPLEAFFFEAIRMQFDVAPGSDIELNVALKG